MYQLINQHIVWTCIVMRITWIILHEWFAAMMKWWNINIVWPSPTTPVLQHCLCLAANAHLLPGLLLLKLCPLHTDSAHLPTCSHGRVPGGGSLSSLVVITPLWLLHCLSLEANLRLLSVLAPMPVAQSAWRLMRTCSLAFTRHSCGLSIDSAQLPACSRGRVAGSTSPSSLNIGVDIALSAEKRLDN